MNAMRNVFVVSVLTFLAAPLLVVAGVSLNKPKWLLFPPEGTSLRWYGELFTQSDWVGALSNSLIIAAFASLFVVSAALPLALYVWKKTVSFRVFFLEQVSHRSCFHR